MDTLLKNNIEGIILKWSYQVQIINKSPFGGKLVHWRGCLYCLLIESLKTKCWKAIFGQTDEVLGKDSAEELNKGNNPGEVFTKQSLPKRSDHQKLYLCIFVNKGNNPGQGLDKKNIKYWHIRCARWYNFDNLDKNIDKNVDKNLHNSQVDVDNVDKSLSNPKNITGWLSNSPTWIQEMLAHRKSLPEKFKPPTSQVPWLRSSSGTKR